MNTKAIEALEYNKIKERIKDFIISPLGERLVDKMMPINHVDRIEKELEEISEIREIIRQSSSIPIQHLVGLELILDKFEKEIVLTAEELSSLGFFLASSKKFKEFMVAKEHLAPTVTSYAYSMYYLEDVIEAINLAIDRNGIMDTASSNLERIRKEIYVVEGRLKNKLETILNSSHYKPYLQDNFISKRNNRYVISVKSQYKKKIQGTVVDSSSTGSTVFIEPKPISNLREQLDSLKSEEKDEEYQILYYITMLAKSYIKEIKINVETMANYDFIFAKGKFCEAMDANTVKVNTDQYIKVIKGKHPLLGKTAVPLDMEVGRDCKTLVITGPNTGGKTVALKTVGLLTMMVQSGLHVPVAKGSEFAIFSDILVDIGDGQSIEQSLSTFSSHIKNIIDILQVANKFTMVILDELGAGTDPTEGEGLAIAVLEQLYEKKALTLSTSHYTKVKYYADEKEGFMNGRMEFDIKTLKPLYRLVIGEAGESNAFLIALRLGMDVNLIERAHKVTYNEDKSYKDMIQEELVPSLSLHPYQKAKKQIKQVSHKTNKFNIGDMVKIPSTHEQGIIFELENDKGEYGIQIKGKKQFISQKRLEKFIDSEDLYPEDYDFDILFETKENRKKKHIMERKHVEELEITE